MNSKLAYLLLGILVKQTIDEFKAIAKQQADDLEKRKERIAKYPGNPAMAAGSLEHYRFQCEQEWTHSIAPELARLSRWQRLWRYVPFAVYLLITIALFVFVLFIPDSAAHCSASNGPQP